MWDPTQSAIAYCNTLCQFGKHGNWLALGYGPLWSIAE
jgi:hypothetical protein